MVESRCGLVCSECGNFPCNLLNGFVYNKEQGGNGKRIDTCRLWVENK